jgi:hypothetical protein
MPKPTMLLVVVLAVGIHTSASAQTERRGGLLPGVIQQLPMGDWIDQKAMRADDFDRKLQKKNDNVLMAPGALTSFGPAIAKTFKINNHGDKTLTINFWNADGAWQSVAVGAATTSLVVCSKCEKVVQIAFNDSKKDRYYTVSLESIVTIQWNEPAKAWEILGGTEVAAPQ